jgi:hypothetical protein
MVGSTKACVRTISVEKGREWEESGVIEDMVCLHSQADPDKKKLPCRVMYDARRAPNHTQARQPRGSLARRPSFCTTIKRPQNPSATPRGQKPASKCVYRRRKTTGGIVPRFLSLRPDTARPPPLPPLETSARKAALSTFVLVISGSPNFLVPGSIVTFSLRLVGEL